ncbi:hypothetical protein DFH07DRAFT_766920 [Mycena maculata]|uniref:Uncharacterized protein n=1 Tax=Mycena maculata TaxID=230809 RepID=A0AAD7K0W3_9AGAR|nr:hypothetical protein DFH07DRAFT_766920 [Mycena maculata]
MQLISTTLSVLILSFFLGVGGATAPDQDCSAKRDYCGVMHDGVAMQYRACCSGLSCVAHDHIDREVTDIYMLNLLHGHSPAASMPPLDIMYIARIQPDTSTKHLREMIPIACIYLVCPPPLTSSNISIRILRSTFLIDGYCALHSPSISVEATISRIGEITDIHSRNVHLILERKRKKSSKPINGTPESNGESPVQYQYISLDTGMRFVLQEALLLILIIGIGATNFEKTLASGTNAEGGMYAKCRGKKAMVLHPSVEGMYSGRVNH